MSACCHKNKQLTQTPTYSIIRFQFYRLTLYDNDFFIKLLFCETYTPMSKLEVRMKAIIISDDLKV